VLNNRYSSEDLNLTNAITSLCWYRTDTTNKPVLAAKQVQYIDCQGLNLDDDLSLN